MDDKDFDIIDLEDKTEVLELDSEVSGKIDEMLDFFDDSVEKIEDQSNLEELVSNSKSSNNIEIKASQEALDDYKVSIKDFNIKNAKIKKIVKKSMLYTIIVMLLIFEVFINKTGEVLSEIRVYATNYEPIKIEQNDKFGFISSTGEKIVNPKYSYADSFINGYSIVKDSSNLPLIINKGGKIAVPTGNYFSLNRTETDIIASKVTKKGLKYGILDGNLKIKTKFIYDLINFKEDVYLFTKNNEVGIINKKGKEIYSYKLTDNISKVINIDISKTINNDNTYASIKVNSSSFIINIKDGTIVKDATVNNIIADENNVFYTVENGKKTYYYVKDNKVIFETDSYENLKVFSIESGIIKAYNSNFTYDYISIKTLTNIKKDLSEKDVFEGDKIFIYKEFDSKTNKLVYSFVKDGEVYKSLPADFEVSSGFINGILKVKLYDGTYTYINEEGDFITDIKFVEAGDFDKSKQAIAKTENGYGVINSDGKIIIDFENNDIKMANDEYKKNVNSTKNVFFAVKKENRYALYNNNGKRVDKNNFYEDVTFDLFYPVLLLESDAEDLLFIPDSNSKITLTSSNSDYVANSNYILIKNEYYNYNGNLIYVDNYKKEDNNE